MRGRKYDRAGAAIYRTARWKAVSYEAKRRDGFRCVKCGSTQRLQVDHIIPLRQDASLAYELGNTQCLCVVCHGKKTRQEVFGPLNPERERWHEFVFDT